MPSTIQPRPPTDRERELARMRPLKDSLPLAFGNGHRVEQLITRCCECDTPVPAQLQRGHVVALHAHVAIVEGVGICRTCKVGLPFNLRVYDDGHVTTLMGGAFPWAYTSKAPPLSENLGFMLGRGLRRLASLFETH